MRLVFLPNEEELALFVIAADADLPAIRGLLHFFNGFCLLGCGQQKGRECTLACIRDQQPENNHQD